MARTPFKLKGNPFQRNYGIGSPLHQDKDKVKTNAPNKEDFIKNQKNQIQNPDFKKPVKEFTTDDLLVKNQGGPTEKGTPAKPKAKKSKPKAKKSKPKGKNIEIITTGPELTENEINKILYPKGKPKAKVKKKNLYETIKDSTKDAYKKVKQKIEDDKPSEYDKMIEKDQRELRYQRRRPTLTKDIKKAKNKINKLLGG